MILLYFYTKFWHFLSATFKKYDSDMQVKMCAMNIKVLRASTNHCSKDIKDITPDKIELCCTNLSMI